MVRAIDGLRERERDTHTHAHARARAHTHTHTHPRVGPLRIASASSIGIYLCETSGTRLLPRFVSCDKDVDLHRKACHRQRGADNVLTRAVTTSSLREINEAGSIPSGQLMACLGNDHRAEQLFTGAKQRLMHACRHDTKRYAYTIQLKNDFASTGY